MTVSVSTSLVLPVEVFVATQLVRELSLVAFVVAVADFQIAVVLLELQTQDGVRAVVSARMSVRARVLTRRVRGWLSGGSTWRCRSLRSLCFPVILSNSASYRLALSSDSSFSLSICRSCARGG